LKRIEADTRAGETQLNERRTSGSESESIATGAFPEHDFGEQLLGYSLIDSAGLPASLVGPSASIVLNRLPRPV
jgi:hypothetical protein